MSSNNHKFQASDSVNMSLTDISDNSDDNHSSSTTLTSSSGFGSSVDIQSSTPMARKDDSIIMTRTQDHHPDIIDQIQSLPSSNKDHYHQSPEKPAKKNKKEPEKVYTGMKRYWGLMLAAASSLLLSLVNLIAKILPEYGFEAYGVSFWRYVGIGFPAIPILLFYEFRSRSRRRSVGNNNCDVEKEEGAGHEMQIKPSIFSTVWPITKNWKIWIALISRGIIGSTSAILRFLALKYLTVGDVATIAYSSPAIVTILAHFFLGERCGVVPVIVSLTTILGVAVVAKPPLFTGADSFEPDSMIGISLACGSLFCAALMVIITRKIREVHFALMLLVFGVIGIIQAIIMTYTLGHEHVDIPYNMIEFLLTMGVASFSFLGQLGVILAVKFEQAGPVALLRSNDVIFSFLLQFCFLGVIPDMYSVIGAVIVLTGVLVIAARKWIETLSSDSGARKYFGWVLY